MFVHVVAEQIILTFNLFSEMFVDSKAEIIIKISS